MLLNAHTNSLNIGINPGKNKYLKEYHSNSIVRYMFILIAVKTRLQWRAMKLGGFR
jgi:hypothetical protein